MGDVMHVDQSNPDEAALAAGSAVLLAGGVVVMPTDSVYGIGCAAVPDNPAHKRIFKIKHRDTSQTLPLLVSSLDDASQFVAQLSPEIYRLASAFWPGALTLVAEASKEVPQEYRAKDGTIALRVPDSRLVRELSRRVGAPLATTSANTHGVAAATSGSSIEQHIIDAADLTFDAGPAPLAIASTIVSFADGHPHILREGAIPAHRIIKILGK